jgi:phosphoglycolate phosphatase-like HAD superfamily hydrolase
MRLLSDDAIEVLRPDLPHGRFRAVVFDFDGTLSLIREGWQGIMTPMIVEELRRTGANESDESLAATTEAIVVGLNGKPTVVQMARLAEEVARRGGSPKTALEYAGVYQNLLLAMIRGRYEDLSSGRATPADWAVPGVHGLLELLRSRGLTLIVASGTEITHVRREAGLLGLTPYFEKAIYAPVGDDPRFSKRAVIERLLEEYGLRGEELLGFGDGVVETAEMRRAGGVAVGVASHEPPQRGVNPLKREQLIRAGADVIIPDFEAHEQLLNWLFE